MTDSVSNGVRTIGVAVGVPEPWGGFLNECRARAGDPQAAYVPTHLTLLPPTEVPAGRLDEIDRHLAKAAADAEPFILHLRGTGTFRPITDVVFVAVAAGIGECERLQAAIRSGPLDRAINYPYHPHITVAHDVPPEQLDRAFDELADFEAKFGVDSFTLFEHGSDGRWRPQQDFPLGPAGGSSTG